MAPSFNDKYNLQGDAKLIFLIFSTPVEWTDFITQSLPTIHVYPATYVWQLKLNWSFTDFVQTRKVVLSILCCYAYYAHTKTACIYMQGVEGIRADSTPTRRNSLTVDHVRHKKLLPSKCINNSNSLFDETALRPEVPLLFSVWNHIQRRTNNPVHSDFWMWWYVS